MRKVRGRFEIVCVFDDGETYATFVSDKSRSLSAFEIIACGDTQTRSKVTTPRWRLPR